MKWHASRSRILFASLLAGLILATAPATPLASEDGQEAALDLLDAATGLPLGVGLRVGGYGFREVGNDPSASWTDCRMNGIGVFATYALRPEIFGELGIDYYQATGSTVSETGMDRLSVSAVAAIGFRGFPDFVVSPIGQIGLGAEFSHVSWLGYDDASNGVYPMGFIGAGGEVKAGTHLRLGVNLRLYLMAAFEPPVTDDIAAHGHPPSDADMAAAGQLQLWARFDL